MSLASTFVLAPRATVGGTGREASFEVPRTAETLGYFQAAFAV